MTLSLNITGIFPIFLGVNSVQAGATYSASGIDLMANDVGRPEVGCPFCVHIRQKGLVSKTRNFNIFYPSLTI
jgi:hypothetical protein